MREMVLNHASFAKSDFDSAVEHFSDITSSIVELINAQVVQSALRWHVSSTQLRCISGESLEDVQQEARRRGRRDEFVIFRKLTTKYPLLSDIDPALRDRFNLCEATDCGTTALSSDDGKPLLLCAISNWIAVSFPSEPIWRRDEFNVHFDELLEDSTFEARSEPIDNVSCPEHVSHVSARHLVQTREIVDFASLWKRRGTAYPNLSFGPDVEDQLARINLSALPAILKRLAGLDDWVYSWRASGSKPSEWHSKTTDESNSVYQDASLRERRRFASNDGNRELFMRKARFGGAGRIHFRVDENSREIEIGYIGLRLPTKKYK